MFDIRSGIGNYVLQIIKTFLVGWILFSVLDFPRDCGGAILSC